MNLRWMILGAILLSTLPFNAKADQVNNECFSVSSSLPNKVIEVCSIFLNSNPEKRFVVRALNRRALAFRATNDLTRALSDFDTIITLTKEAGYFDNRQSVYRLLGRYDEALKDANEAVSLAPNSAYVYHSRGTVLLEMGRYDEAVDNFTRAFELEPGHVFDLYDRGRAHHFARRFDLAIQDFTQVLKLDPAFPALRERAVALMNSQELAAAEEDIKNYLSARPNDYAAQKIAEQIALRRTPQYFDAQSPKVSSKGRRVALVMGNSAYTNAPSLSNPRNDAGDIAEALRQRGFVVITGFDLNKGDMEKLLYRFASNLDAADVALFFYAGHGLQVNGINYLVPVDAKIDSPLALDFELIKMDLVQHVMEQKPNISNIVILDACRNNPLTRNLASYTGARSLEIGQGLAQFTASVGTLIAFSTQPGNVALDGEGRNSPFSEALAQQLRFGGDREDIYDVLINVRNQVMRSTENRQVPWEHSALRSHFYF